MIADELGCNRLEFAMTVGVNLFRIYCMLAIWYHVKSTLS